MVTSAQNQFVDTLNFEQLAKIFEEGGAKTWNQVDPSFPNEEIAIFGPDAESGTYDFFNEEVLGDPEEGGKKGCGLGQPPKWATADAAAPRAWGSSEAPTAVTVSGGATLMIASESATPSPTATAT